MSRRPAPADVRAAALRALATIAANSHSRTEARALVAKQIGVHPNTIRNWEIDAAPADVIEPGRGATDIERDRARRAQIRALTELSTELADALRESARGSRSTGARIGPV